MKNSRWLIVMVLVFAMIAAACGDGDADETTTTAGGDGGDQPYAGEVVNIFGAMVDADAVAFDNSVKPFEDETGIDVVYEGSGDFETQVGIRIEGGNAPDIALFPQPGLWANFINDMVELGSLGVDLDQMASDLSTYLVELPGQVAAAAGGWIAKVYLAAGLASTPRAGCGFRFRSSKMPVTKCRRPGMTCLP